jgi:hypothetical protein
MRHVALDAGIDFPAVAKVMRFTPTKVARSTRVQPENAPNVNFSYFATYFLI